MSSKNNGTPPRRIDDTRHDWGERTLQGYESLNGQRPPQYFEPDSYEMRKHFGISEFDHTEFQRQKGKIASMVYPDLVIHEWESDITTRPKGTTCVVRGKRGSGKTTLRDFLAVRLMEVNNERVVVRGRQNFSDWRRMRKWTTLYLPSDVDVDITWKEIIDEPTPEPQEIVRDVVRYDGLFDLLETLEERPGGTYNVVYPDPEFRGAEEALERASSVPYRTEVVSQSEAAGTDQAPTPVSHWWFLFMLVRTEFGRVRGEDGEPLWMTLLLDEIGELAPENPPGGPSGHYTWEFVKMLSQMMIDVRSAAVSIIGFCHFWSDIATDWRKQFNFCISMPDDRPNPIRKRASTHPKGWSTVPMTRDLISDKKPGVGLCYSESNFTYFSWDEMDVDDAIRHPEFRLDLGARETVESVDLWFEDRILASFEAPTGLELRVKDGQGVIDCMGPTIREELQTPQTSAFEDTEFIGLRENARSSELLLDTPDGKRVVAEIPHTLDPNTAQTGGVASD